MERLAIPPEVGTCAPIRGRTISLLGIELAYSDSDFRATFNFRTSFW